MTVHSLSIPVDYTSAAVIGFSLDRTLSDAANPYLDSKRDACVINGKRDDKDDDTSMLLKLRETRVWNHSSNGTRTRFIWCECY